MREALSSPEWLITEDGFDPERANVRETLCTVGNGYLGTRGTLEEGHPGDLSGTYLAGVYDAHDSPSSTWSTRRTGCRSRCSSTARGSTCATPRYSTTSARSTCAPACCTGAPCSSTTTAAAPGWRRCAAPPWPTGARARCAWRSRRSTTRARSPSRAPSTAAAQPGAAAGLPRGHHVPAGDALGEVGAHPPPRPHRARGAGTSATWRCARSRAASPSATPRPPSVGRAGQQRLHRWRTSAVVWRATFRGRADGAAGQAGAHRHVTRRRRRRGRRSRRLPRGARGGPGGRVRRDRRGERRRVGERWGDCDCAIDGDPAAPRPCASGSTTC